MKLYICLDYEHSTPRYYSREMNFSGGAVHKKRVVQECLEHIYGLRKKKKRTLTAVNWEVVGLAIANFLQMNINNFKDQQIKNKSINNDGTRQNKEHSRIIWA